MRSAEDFEFDLLGLLTTDAESFAVLHADLIRIWGYSPDFHVDEVLRALRRVLSIGWLEPEHADDPPTPMRIAAARAKYLQCSRRKAVPATTAPGLGRGIA